MKNKSNLSENNHLLIRNFSADELSQKLLHNILSHNDIEVKIKEFDASSYYHFNKSLGFQLGRVMTKHSNPMDLINWKVRVRDEGIMNDDDNAKSTIETLNIVNDFLNAESQKAMERILVYRDHEFCGEIFKNAPCYDYSIVSPKEQLDHYSSFLFDEESFSIVFSYYLEFISLFPITLTEFETIIFYFLLFLTKEQYPAEKTYGEALDFVKRLSNIVKMRYIDIHNKLILAFLQLIYSDEELSDCSQAIYCDIKMKWEALCDQAFSIGS